MVDLIHFIAGHYYKKMRGRGIYVERDELVGEAGLCYAIALKRHDPKRGPFKRLLFGITKKHFNKMMKKHQKEKRFFEKVEMLKNEGCIF